MNDKTIICIVSILVGLFFVFLLAMKNSSGIRENREMLNEQKSNFTSSQLK